MFNNVSNKVTQLGTTSEYCPIVVQRLPPMSNSDYGLVKPFAIPSLKHPVPHTFSAKTHRPAARRGASLIWRCAPLPRSIRAPCCGNFGPLLIGHATKCGQPNFLFSSATFFAHTGHHCVAF